MASLPEEHLKVLKSLGYEPLEDETDRLRYRNEEAGAEIEVVEVMGQYHFDFNGFDLLGTRTMLDDLIFSKDVLARMTEESKTGQELAEGTPGAPE
ncbi:MAG: hypothetical protein R3200_06510 [Xanthomonadales bacterium]|nr:hypothetical protein [Xanthomonadales bacterium]